MTEPATDEEIATMKRSAYFDCAEIDALIARIEAERRERKSWRRVAERLENEKNAEKERADGIDKLLEHSAKRIAELERDLHEERQRASDYLEVCQGMTDWKRRIAELERDCADMAEDVFTEAFQHHGDGKGGIHPALRHKFERDIDTARKYLPAERLADAEVSDDEC